VEGFLLFIGIVAYTVMNWYFARQQNRAIDRVPDPSAGTSVPGITSRWQIDIGLIIGGLAVLVFGSHLLVTHSIIVAELLGVSEAVIGLTIVAAGTSMPELATSIVAALRKQSDIAIGNIVGSNIFNILGILGVASLISPLNAPGIAWTDYAAMIGFTVLLIPLLYRGRLLHRVEGTVLLALYGLYLFVLWPK
jgi:cation:H+ antiporter